MSFDQSQTLFTKLLEQKQITYIKGQGKKFVFSKHTNSISSSPNCFSKAKQNAKMGFPIYMDSFHLLVFRTEKT